MSATDFMPRREADVLVWSRSFNNTINSGAGGPAAVGLSAEQASDYNAKHNAFAAAYTLAKAAITRTPPKIVAKNDALRSLRREARRLVNLIHATPGVSDSQKLMLGLTVRRPGGRQPRIPRPRTAPNVYVVSQDSGRAKIRLRDSVGQVKRGKPTGVKWATIITATGDAPPKDLSKWTLLCYATRTEHTFTMPRDVPPGTRVWVAAFWNNLRLQRGPVSKPISLYTQFGVSPVAA